MASRLTVVSVACALFMQQIDSTALSTALPTLARVFNTNPIHLKVALTCYILTQAMFIPASGWIADRFGGRRVFIWALVVFLLGSVLCGLSHSLPQLVAARVVQGLGGAMMMPVARIIVVGAFRRQDLMHAMIWLTTPALVGPILGPPLSGLILGFADWPWIFFINVPFGLLGMLGVMKFVPKREQPHPGAFDFVGFALSSTAISATMIGAESIGLTPGWVQVVSLTIAGLLWAGYLRHARGQARPVLDLALLKLRTLRASVSGGVLFRISIGATPFLMPLFLQGALGWTPLHAGLLTMTTAIGAFLSRPGAAFVIGRLGYRKVLLITAMVSSVMVAAPLGLLIGVPVGLLVALMVFGGLFRAYQFTSLNTIGFADVPDEAISRATTLMSVIQQASLSMGITLAALMLHLSQAVLRAPGEHLQAKVFILPFVGISVVALSATLIYLRLPADAGRRR